MDKKWLSEAVSNNAVWCDAIAASHRISANWNDSVWFTEHPMPPLYPNIITLRSGDLIDECIDTIDTRLSLKWGVKDSFSELELDGKGFTLAFEAHWFCRIPEQNVTETYSDGFHLKTVKTQSDLDRWIAAWGEGDRIFNLSLLKNTDIELIYLERDGNVVSGLVTNHSGDSIGISNMFGESNDILGCVSLVAETHSSKGIVGYDGKAEVVALSNVGFQEIGNLRVWLRS